MKSLFSDCKITTFILLFKELQHFLMLEKDKTERLSFALKKYFCIL